jgi:hypothetical protein
MRVGMSHLKHRPAERSMEASSVSGGRLCALCCVVLHPVIFCVIFLLLFNDTMELAVKPGVGLGRCRCYDRPRIEGLEGFGFEAQQAHMYMYKMYKTENTPRLNVKIFPISAILHLQSSLLISENNDRCKPSCGVCRARIPSSLSLKPLPRLATLDIPHPPPICAAMSNPWIKFVHTALTHPKHTPWIVALLILGDAALCALVIWKISCELAWRVSGQDRTEIGH